MLGLIFWVRKQVPVVDTRRTLYFGRENRYQWQVHVALYILDGKTGTSGRYMLRLMFWVGNKVPATSQVSGTCWSLYFEWENKYLQPARSHVQAGLHILGGKTDTCDRRGLRYMPSFIFWVGKQVPAIGQVSGICLASYFRWENRYLRPARSQILNRLHILGQKTGT